MKKNILKLLISIFLLLNFTQNIYTSGRFNKKYFIYSNTSCEQISFGKDKNVYTYPSKKYGKCALVKYNKISKQSINLYTTEVNFLTTLNHENIIKLIDNDQKNLIFFLEKGETDLYDYIYKSKLKTIEEKLNILEQIAQALVYLHNQGIIHGDIKTENVVLVNNKCKLIDFSYSLQTDEDGQISINYTQGTDIYAAPEILNSMLEETRKNYILSTKSDIWSFGMLAYVVMVQKIPDKAFEETYKHKYSLKEYISAILGEKLLPGKENKKIYWIPQLPAITTKNCILNKLIKLCLQLDPNNRPTAQEILEWIRAIKRDLNGEFSFEDLNY
ncbi:MAG: hypothetical protein SZ59_C0002G0189 [candidate division TM6 bacterium GW2011_GWF2_28_16]|nr:MAG: hypothetical protein SZ59_C0002G0189 [candidate division TM6 bacterium GW2011_GWF2_28_16]